MFLFVTLFIIELILHTAGEDLLASLLLSGSVFQPVLCALIGLIPGCGVSVLLTELYLGGTISFGAAIAGLSTGAGFGYILLLKPRAGRKRALAVILSTYAVAAVGGTLIQLFIG